MASPYSFHERASPVSDTVALFFSAFGPRPSRLRPPPSAYAFCSLAVRFDSMVKMAS
jgi:hypothetical protein